MMRVFRKKKKNTIIYKNVVSPEQILTDQVKKPKEFLKATKDPIESQLTPQILLPAEYSKGVTELKTGLNALTEKVLDEWDNKFARFTYEEHFAHEFKAKISKVAPFFGQENSALILLSNGEIHQYDAMANKIIENIATQPREAGVSIFKMSLRNQSLIVGSKKYLGIYHFANKQWNFIELHGN